jgi:acylphosphatase
VSGWDTAARRYVISGRVQGVGYRMFAARVASALRLKGGVRNRPDGGVEVVAMGPLHALDRLEAALHEGPRFARVESLEAETVPVGALPAEPFDVEF